MLHFRYVIQEKNAIKNYVKGRLRDRTLTPKLNLISWALRCLAAFNVSGGREVTERQLERAMAYVNLVYNRSGWSVTAGHLRYMNTKDPFGLCCVLLK